MTPAELHSALAEGRLDAADPEVRKMARKVLGLPESSTATPPAATTTRSAPSRPSMESVARRYPGAKFLGWTTEGHEKWRDPRSGVRFKVLPPGSVTLKNGEK